MDSSVSVVTREPAAVTDAQAVPERSFRQGGVFTARQARAAGWSGKQVARRLATSRWVVVAGRGLTHASAERTAAAMAWATHLSYAGGAPPPVISHLTAAALFGFPVPIEPPGHVICDSRHRVDGTQVHRTPVPPQDVWTRAGLLVTSPARTAVDCLALLPHRSAMALWAWLLTRQVLTPHDLGAAVRGRLGRTGTPQLCRILRIAAGGAASLAERRMHDLLRRGGVTGWRPNASVFDAGRLIGAVDILFERERLVVEIDGWLSHNGQEAFRTDRRRQNRLVAAGYTVLRFTWDDLEHRPDAVLAEILGAIARARVPATP